MPFYIRIDVVDGGVFVCALLFSPFGKNDMAKSTRFYNPADVVIDICLRSSFVCSLSLSPEFCVVHINMHKRKFHQSELLFFLYFFFQHLIFVVAVVVFSFWFKTAAGWQWSRFQRKYFALTSSKRKSIHLKYSENEELRKQTCLHIYSDFASFVGRRRNWTNQMSSLFSTMHFAIASAAFEIACLSNAAMLSKETRHKARQWNKKKKIVFENLFKVVQMLMRMLCSHNRKRYV